MKINFVINGGVYNQAWGAHSLKGVYVREFMHPRFQHEIERGIFAAMNMFARHRLIPSVQLGKHVSGGLTEHSFLDLNWLQNIPDSALEGFLDHILPESVGTMVHMRDMLKCNARVSKQDLARFFLAQVHLNLNVVIDPTGD